MADVEDYLQEGFDPRSVTIPRLRSILVTHNVDYPSSAKKPQLVELVTEHVLSQAAKLRAQRARAKRSSLGIVNAGSAQDTSGWDDDELSPPRSVRRSKSPRKSSGRVKVEEEEDFSRARTASTRLSRSVSRQLSMEPEDIASARRARRTVTPQIKPEPEQVEEEDDESTVYDEEPSVFTDDNPFQSGSSPLPESTPRASASRRRTAGSDVNKTAKSARRRTAGTEYLRTSATPEPTRRGKTPEFHFEAGEEFTPEAQLELEEASASGEVVPVRKSSAPRRQGSIKTPFFVLLMALVGAYMAWYRQEKIAVGYCGLGRPAKQIIPDDIPVPDALLPFIEPLCEPCPKHAFCYEDFSIQCQDDFILRHHPLSLGGLVPIPPTCEPDSEKARRVKAVADKAVEELRERRAKFECGELTDDAGQPSDTPAVAEEELKESVSRKRAKKMSNKEFDELWEAAIGDITDREEIEVTSQTTEVEDDSVPDPTERPVPPIFQRDTYRAPLSLAFQSRAPSSAPSEADWQDIDSQLDL
ncbi:hypothetical protein VHEMI02678 [[Torrubiella] hemipterigena]|uniref:Inner nuclear membrane protein SRC1 n=1 Tax=[Torrubiella] hemipterigena TaxID=1531966 RepID=A0A0A1T8P5_9HYPO|nr:hypothetical protein VHEMI02678 [[Torrubiella] hemipterigena]